jgi:hypothetical protein
MTNIDNLLQIIDILYSRKRQIIQRVMVTTYSKTITNICCGPNDLDSTRHIPIYIGDYGFKDAPNIDIQKLDREIEVSIDDYTQYKISRYGISFLDKYKDYYFESNYLDDKKIILKISNCVNKCAHNIGIEFQTTTPEIALYKLNILKHDGDNTIFMCKSDLEQFGGYVFLIIYNKEENNKTITLYADENDIPNDIKNKLSIITQQLQPQSSSQPQKSSFSFFNILTK